MGWGVSFALSEHPSGSPPSLGGPAAPQQPCRDSRSGASESSGWVVIAASFSSKERVGAGGRTCAG